MGTVPHQPSFNLHPLALLAAAFAAGILCARLTGAPASACLACGLVLSAAAVYAFARGERGSATLLVALSFAACGATLARAEESGVRADSVRRFFEEGRVGAGEAVELTGVLARAPETAPDGMLLVLAVENLRARGEAREASGTVELFAPARDGEAWEGYAALDLRRGARLRVTTALTREGGFRNPGVEPLADYLGRRGVDARGVVKSPLLVERLDDAPVFAPLLWLDDWRARLLARFDELFSTETSGVLAASVLGNRRRLTRASAERFREGGTFHVLVISGLHITFVGGVAWRVARRLTRSRVRQWAAASACVWAYAVAVGAEASVVRAALMFTLAALAPALGRPSGTLNALGGAALALLALSPRTLFDPSFQLTFLAVLSIVALAWPLLTRLREVGAWRPTRAAPYPPACHDSVRTLAEALHWSERGWRRDSARATYDCRLFKTRAAERLERWRVQAPLRHAFSGVVVSAAVQAGMLPLFVVYFHRLTPASLLLNLYVGALMTVLSFAALAAAAAAQLGAWAAEPFVHAAELTNWLMAHGVDPFDAAGVAGVRLPEYAGAGACVYLLYYAPLLVLARSLARWSPLATPSAAPRGADGDAEARRSRLLVRVSFASWAALACVVVFHPFSAPRADGRLRVDFLDVGQGDAALVTMPDGATLLVDGGGRVRFRRDAKGSDAVEEFERDERGVGEAAVAEYLWWRGLERVDYVLATHADADHTEGLADIVRDFRVRAAFCARAPASDPEFARLTEALARAGVPLEEVARGDRLRFGRVEADVLWPHAAPPGAPSANDDSVVLRLTYGGRSFLLTGDVEARSERALTDARSPLRADVVKVAHHGSRTSSTEAFVAAVRPSFAVVSVARASPYGHPRPEVIARWRTAGALVLTTADRGMITASTDGADLRVETFVK